MAEFGSIYRSRADQVLEYLRERLLEGAWKGVLPSERQLAAQLNVGRGTLRTALARLEEEGAIVERSFSGARVAPEIGVQRSSPVSIGVVFNSQVDKGVGKGLIYLGEIRYFFARRGIDVVVHRCPLNYQRISVRFQKMISSSSHSLWIFFSPTEVIQRWCMEKQIPAMMIGERVEELKMPAVTIDTRAACRHAVGQMIAKGHRRLALILPINEKGEDHQSRLGFHEAIKESRYCREIKEYVEVHRQTKESLRHMVERLLGMKERPTAWLICRQGHVITIQSYLLQLGVRIPGEISIVSRDSDIYLEDLEPEPSRYVSDTPRVARGAARYAQRVIEDKSRGHSSGDQLRIVPQFVPGRTLGECQELRP